MQECRSGRLLSRPLRESKYQSRLKKQYEARGSIVVKMNPSSDVPKGFPDLLVVESGGQVRFVETKSEGGVVEPAQRHWHDRLRELGHEVLVVRPEVEGG